MPKFFITTSIPYVNAPPHLGHALEYVQADALARYQRVLGNEVFFLTGTDEHGKKIAEAAKKAGKEPQEFVDDISARFKELLAALGISNDDFIRTSDESRHIPAARKIWEILEKKGDIYKGTYEGRYCTGCEAFLREADIQDGKCMIHNKPAEEVKEENHFFRFSKYAKRVEEFIRKGEIVVLPEYRKKEALNLFSDEGVRDVSFSRPSTQVGWGIPVPGDESQTMYVWVDALLNYLSGAGLGADVFTKRWPPDVQVIGKDILRFHGMIWPAMLLSLGLQMPKRILVHGHISIEGKKMSKSLGNVVDPMDLIKKYPVDNEIPSGDAVRYYLLREIPSGDDGDFSIERMHERYVADFKNGFGNLLSRVIAIGDKHRELFSQLNANPDFEKIRSEIQKSYDDAFDDFCLHRALEIVLNIAIEANKEMEESKPWKLVTEKPQDAVRTMSSLAGKLCAIAYFLEPFLPDHSKKIQDSLTFKLTDKQIGKNLIFIRLVKPSVAPPGTN